ncbi:unnamed protein product [Adineta ricciae]|uniref:Uncharacterized protein n=1 Tax=Adineta ricciae TaxID=249248 RepID=A0A815VKU8_ADIRI|nr:unnamed protein product [Adineta ricciae]CAF1537033.1 unnamed protein product [Adineta ricciae]
MITNISDPIFGIWNTTVGGDSAPSNSINPTDAGNYMPYHPPEKILDNRTSTKYLNHGNGDSGVYSSTKGVGTGFYITPRIGLSTLKMFRFATADDREDRDPLSVTIECSNATSNNLKNGFVWLLIHNGSTGLMPNPGRRTFGIDQLVDNNKVCESYRVLVSSQRGSDTGVQYSIFHLLGWY